MNKPEIQVPAGRVDARDLDDHALSQLIASPRVDARERERVLVKLEPLASQTLNRDQALDLCQVEAHKEAHAADPRNGSGIALAQTILVILGNLDLLRRMAGGVGRTLGIAACTANLRQDARQRLATPADQPRRARQGILAAQLLIRQLQFEHTMDNKVRIASDRARKVAVARRGERKVALVARLVQRALHTAQ